MQTGVIPLHNLSLVSKPRAHVSVIMRQWGLMIGYWKISGLRQISARLTSARLRNYVEQRCK